MADVKISQLPAATTPLTGPEQIPLVQGGVTKQVTVSDMLTDANLGTPTVIDLVNATNVPVNEAIGVLPVVNGGTGLTNPSLVAGTNVSVTGTWPNQTINASATIESVTATAPVVSSGGTNPVISMAAATGSVNGYLTSTDWTTFNNKVTPGGALGTPSSGTATNLTGLPLTTGVTGILPIANGGTNASTAPNARGNILPAYSGNAGKVLAVNPGATDVEYISIGGVGTVTSVGTGTGLTGGPITAAGTIALADTAVTPGAYTSANITVDAQGRITAAASGSSNPGTVTDVSVVSANGLAGTVATSTSTPAITLSTTVTGLVKGNGTALSAATAGTDYVAPGGALGTPSSGTATNLTGLPLSTGVTGTLPVVNGGSGATTLTGYLKGNGTSAFTASSTVPSSDITGLGTMAAQNATSVAITGGAIDGTAVGGTTRATIAGTTELVGPAASANFTRFPGALAVVSNTDAGIQQNESMNIGLLAEGVSSNTTWGSGLYGAGYTNTVGNGRGTGVTGEGHVSAATDTGVAVGVRGYANDTHTGNYNIGLYGDASNGDAGLTYGGNVALFLANGNIVTSSASAKSWYLGGNMTFDGEGATKTIGVTNGAVFALGTPSSGTLTNATGLPLSTGVTGTLPIANGGSGQTTAQTAMNAFAGAVTSGSYLRGNGTNVVMSTIQAADVPTLNQNTTGTAAGLSTTLAVGSGGTGLTSVGSSGNVLTSNGTAWVSQAPTGVSTGKSIAMAMIFGF